MIRRLKPEDTAEIAAIYNGYVLNSAATFETEALTVEAMRARIAEISEGFPFFVWELDGKVAGFCCAHPWKKYAAYKHTLETSVYLVPAHTGKGIGKALMLRLIGECRARGFKALIACITEGNAASDALHLELGFRKVSHFEKVGFKLERWLDVMDYELIL